MNVDNNQYIKDFIEKYPNATIGEQFSFELALNKKQKEVDDALFLINDIETRLKVLSHEILPNDQIKLFLNKIKIFKYGT